MMPEGASVKGRLEEFWGALFSDALKSYCGATEVNLVRTREDPPDALYDVFCANDRPTRMWCEITNVYPSEEAARDIFREARGEIKDISTVHEIEDWLEPDLDLTQKAVEVICKKLTKKSYESLYKRYGSGHLLLVIPYQTFPLVNKDTFQCLQSYLPLQCLDRQSVFCHVWMAYKQADYDNGLVIAHLPDSNANYAFALLWSAKNGAAP